MSVHSQANTEKADPRLKAENSKRTTAVRTGNWRRRAPKTALRAGDLIDWHQTRSIKKRGSILWKITRWKRALTLHACAPRLKIVSIAARFARAMQELQTSSARADIPVAPESCTLAPADVTRIPSTRRHPRFPPTSALCRIREFFFCDGRIGRARTWPVTPFRCGNLRRFALR